MLKPKSLPNENSVPLRKQVLELTVAIVKELAVKIFFFLVLYSITMVFLHELHIPSAWIGASIALVLFYGFTIALELLHEKYPLWGQRN